MKKRKPIYFLILCLAMAGASNLFSLDNTTNTGKNHYKGLDIDFNLGLNLSLNSTRVKMGTQNTANSLAYSYLALELNADVSNSLTLGLLAGFTMDHFKNPVVFTGLPLSLAFDREKNNALVLGLTAASKFSLFGDFSMMTRGQFLYFTPFKKDSPITLPSVTGTATSRLSFYQAAVEFLGQYDGFSTVTVFFGPQLVFTGGKYKVTETIQALTGNQAMSFKQKNILGVVGGVNFDLGENINVDLSAALLSKTAVTARIIYAF